jgi:hypothetical protein
MVLRDIKFPHGASSSVQINTFLQTLQDALVEAGSRSQVYPFELAYENEVNRNRDVHRQMEACRKELQGEIDKAALTDPFTEEEKQLAESDVQGLEADLINYGLVTVAAQFYRASMCNYFLVATPPAMSWTRSHHRPAAVAADEEEATEKRHYQRRGDWHAFAIKIDQWKVSLAVTRRDQSVLTITDVHLRSLL